MNFTTDNIKKISNLSKINIEENNNLQFNTIIKDLNNILKMFKELDKINTDNIKPMINSIKKYKTIKFTKKKKMNNLFNNDKNNKKRKEMFFIIPKIMEN